MVVKLNIAVVDTEKELWSSGLMNLYVKRI